MNEFEKLANELTKTKDNNILVKLDEFEENIKLIEKLDKQYKTIKEELKKQMLVIANNDNLEQVKWITPKGIKITLSVGKETQFEKKIKEEFNVEILKEKYPDIYQECIEQKEYLEKVYAGSNDRLVVTVPKE